MQCAQARTAASQTLFDFATRAPPCVHAGHTKMDASMLASCGDVRLFWDTSLTGPLEGLASEGLLRPLGGPGGCTFLAGPWRGCCGLGRNDVQELVAC